MMQQQGDAASAERLAQAALETAEKALQEARTSNVQVKPLGDRILITMPSSDGNRRAIEVSADGKQVLSVDGMSTEAIMPPRATSSPRTVRQDVNGLVITVCALIAAVSILGPLARAAARRLEGARGGVGSDESARRLAAIEHAVEAVAVEVERISEGQRFTTKLLADREQEGVIR
jgi:hypothetical protein